MKNLFLKTLAIGLFLLAMPMKQQAQQPTLTPMESTIDFDITGIDVFDERIIFLHNLVNDGRFNVVNSERDGVFIISADPAYPGMDLQSTFNSFKADQAKAFAKMDKEEASETAIEFKSRLPKEFTNSLMMDFYVRSRQNNLCANADPFCTDNGLYEFPAGVNAGSGEPGPNYQCLSSTPNPAWYYMRIGNPGAITIRMYSTPSYDIDFCCWGPFDDPVAPCPNGLTGSKVVSCSYSMAATENCQIPSNAQTGKYYILVITNYSNQSCNISFSKTGGSGTTDCGIMPPMVENGGPYCVGQTITLTGNAQQGATYSWSGPGGWTANGQNVTRPNCTMAMAGEYICTIHVGTQTNSASTEVTVFPSASANFTYTKVCKGDPTQFTSTSTTNPANQNATCQWNFGDGQTGTGASVSHTYAQAGNYEVTLTVNTGGQCTFQKQQNVEVYAVPVANAGNDQTVQYGGTAQLHGSGGTGTFNYHWEPANKVTNPNAQNTTTVGLTESTTFTLTVTHPQGGCSSTDQVSVMVSGSNMTATASATPSSICQGETSQLNARAVGGNVNNYSYSWTPTAGLSSPNIANPVAHPTQTTTYTCHVSDGYTALDVQTTVTVNNPEYESVDQYICPGDSYNFYGTSYSEEGDYDYVTTTAQGCEKVITLHLHHYPSYQSAHTDNEFICPGTSYNFHGHYYNTSGTYSENLHTIHGCDSIVWLNLTVYPANDTIIVDPSICTSQTYNFHGTEYSHDGDIAYFDTIDNHGCLLVEKLVLSVGPYQMPPKEEIRWCVPWDDTPSYYWDKTGLTYTQDTQDEIILPDPNGGCDIKYRLDLKFHQEFYQTDTVTVCDDYEWPVIPGSNYTSTNHHIVKTFSHTGGQGFDCDSTYILDLTVNYSKTKTIDTTACNEYIWVGQNNQVMTINESGTYTRHFFTEHDCDSTVTVNIQIDYSPSFPRVEGHAWVVGGSEFQYTVEEYWVDADGTHETSWELRDVNGQPFNKWDLIKYGDNYDRCQVYIYTYELDSVQLLATTVSTGSGNEICGDSFTKSKWIHCSSYDVPEISTHCSVDIYPNPNDGNITLSMTHMEGDILVKVFDMQGAMVDAFQLSNGYETSKHVYNTERLTAGVYFFSIASKEGVVTKKVVIMK